MSSESNVNWLIYYRDEGPSGPCGQAVSVTRPWRRLYRFEGTRREMADKVDVAIEETRRHRKRPSFEFFVDDPQAAEEHGYQPVMELNNE